MTTCLTAGLASGAHAQPPAQAPAAQVTAVEPVAANLFKDLTPLASGPGVLFTDARPRDEAAPPSADTLAFGAGCTRWLQLEFSDHLALGKMVFWPEFSSAVSEIRWEAGQLPATEAARLARRTAATHAVLTHIGGDEKAAELSLQLITLPGGATLGEPIALKGSYSEINAALPGAARTLLALLKVDAAGVPPTTGGEARSLINCGRAPLSRYVPLPAGLRKALLQEAPKMALAGILAYRNTDGTASDKLLEFAASSENLLVKAYVAYDRPDLLEEIPARLKTAMDRNVPNYMLLSLKTKLAGYAGELEEAERAAELTVRSSVSNPQAWGLLADIISDRADAIRHGRARNQITPEEWALIKPLYPRWEAAAARVTELNPDKATGWRDLSSAAAFNGNRTRATAAFWKAQGLAPDNIDIYYWGLQQLQPKWGGQPAELRRLIGLAEERPAVMRATASSLMEALSSLNYSADADIVLADRIFQNVVLDPEGWFSTQPETRKALEDGWNAVFPRGSKVGWQALSGLLHETAEKMIQSRDQDQLGSEERRALNVMYRFWELASARWTTYDPQNGLAWLDRAKSYLSAGSTNSGWAMKNALPLAPADPEINKWDLILQGRKWDANNEDIWKTIERIAADPKLLNYLAADVATAFPEGEMTEAQLEIVSRVNIKLEELKKSTNPYDHRDLGAYFWRKERMAEARAEYNSWVRLAPKNADAEYWLGSLMQTGGDNEGALKRFRRVVELDTTYAAALYDIGDLLTTVEEGQEVPQEKLTEALGYFQRATVHMPLWVGPWFSLGETLRKLKRPDEALVAYRRVLALSDASFQENAQAAAQIEALEIN